MSRITKPGRSISTYTMYRIEHIRISSPKSMKIRPMASSNKFNISIHQRYGQYIR